MPKKKNVNLPLIEVFLGSLAVHVVLLVVFGGVIISRIMANPDAVFEVPTFNEPIDQAVLQRQQQVQKETRKAPPINQKITVKMPTNLQLNKLNIQLPDLMPTNVTTEDYGLGGGMSDFAGGDIGLSMPEINFLGVRSKGERFIFLLNADDYMLTDKAGGIEGYQIVKEELIEQVESLPPGAVFNVIFFRGRATLTFSQSGMVGASAEQKAALAKWIDPINKTFDQRGIKSNIDPTMSFEPYGGENWGNWIRALQIAFEQGADSVYLVDNSWSWFRASGFSESESEFERRKENWEREHGDDWRKFEAQAKAWLDRENAARERQGRQKRVITNFNAFVIERFPDAREHRPIFRAHDGDLPPEELISYVRSMRETLWADRDYQEPSVNVILLTAANARVGDKGPPDGPDVKRDFTNFGELARRLDGKFRVLLGLQAVRALTDS